MYVYVGSVRCSDRETVAMQCFTIHDSRAVVTSDTPLARARANRPLATIRMRRTDGAASGGAGGDIRVIQPVARRTTAAQSFIVQLRRRTTNATTRQVDNLVAADFRLGSRPTVD
jgi:hypothetical protein